MLDPRRPLAASLLLAATLGLALGCSERLADLDDDGDTLYPTCMAIAGTLGFWGQDQQRVILDPDGSAASVCLCMTVDEFQDGSRKHELNDLLYDECLRLVELYGYESSECLQDYESGYWLGNNAIAVGDWAGLNNRGLSCGDELPGCAVDRQPGGIAFILFVMVTAITRLRKRKSS